MEINKVEFAKRLKQLREDKGMTVRVFEKFIRISMTSYYSYEKGRIIPNLETSNILCESLSINLQWFTTGEGPKKRTIYNDKEF